jgi:hypothetical protein
VSTHGLETSFLSAKSLNIVVEGWFSMIVIVVVVDDSSGYRNNKC